MDINDEDVEWRRMRIKDLTTLYKYSHYRQNWVLESDGVDAALPLGHGAVHVDGAWLGAQPHGGHHTRHLLHLRVRDLVVLARLRDPVLDVGRGLLHEPPVHSVSVLARDLHWLLGCKQEKIVKTLFTLKVCSCRDVMNQSVREVLES